MTALYAFATWEQMLTLLRGKPGVSGWFSSTGWGVSLSDPRAAAPVRRALAEAGVREVMFAADEPTTLHLFEVGPAVEPAFGYPGPNPGTLVLADGAAAGLWRRLPRPVSGVVPAPSADPALLERTLRERLPDAVGATEEEIAAAEEQLGVALSEELKALFRVTRVYPPEADGSGDWEADYAEGEAAAFAVGCELFGLDGLFAATAATRLDSRRSTETEAVVASDDAAVLDLVGSPGWIAFGSNGGDLFAVDMTPGPGGHLGQVILISHEESIGAELYGESLTELVLNGFEWRKRAAGGEAWGPPVAARIGGMVDLESAAHPALEVVRIFGRGGTPPVSLAPIVGLPRVRTLVAHPGTLADPLEIAGMSGLEYLAIGLDEWRILLDAGAVPRGLLAANVEVRGHEHPVEVVELANELLALWGRPLITHTVVRG
ncbi:SMI1/KNR4 family protein [Kitasatospora sp. NPDC051170]|uniref:SMI1/KNR4 family protein n=1 Tax=Kitasatospora sp. NPDC051170 TaxID=3364056 RepID=UPI0037B7F245